MATATSQFEPNESEIIQEEVLHTSKDQESNSAKEENFLPVFGVSML
jgi:hypothetical protein